MKKRKVITLKPFNIVDSEKLKISKYNDEYLFDISNILTEDITEAVALMMRNDIQDDDKIWNTTIDKINPYETDPKKALYWLSGGDDEWLSGENYKFLWKDCVTLYSDEFSEKIIEMVDNSNTLIELKYQFEQNLNLPILYEFALKNNIA